MNSSNRGRPPTPTARPPADPWQSTRAQSAADTQFASDEDDYLAAEKQEIGRRIGLNERELFVSGDPVLALRQQFERLRPDFVAVHDISTSASRKLLGGIAAASGRTIQKLVIRRQGYGTALASMEFVELPTSEGSTLRMYSTEAVADTAARHGLARMLLAFSRLGVIIIGDVPEHSIASSLKSFHEFMVSGPWPNRQMLLLPLGAGNGLAAQGAELARGTAVSVRTTPQITRATDAWAYINGTRGGASESATHDGRRGPPMAGTAGGSVSPLPSGATRSPMTTAVGSPAADQLTLRANPEATAASTRAAAPKTLLDRYVAQLSEVPGMLSCCVFDIATGVPTAHFGARPSAAELAFHGKALLANMGVCSASMGLGNAVAEAAITFGSHHLLLHSVPGHPGLALHAALDKKKANLSLARLQILRMDSVFDKPHRP